MKCSKTVAIQQIILECDAKREAAAKAGKAVMWEYYGRMADEVRAFLPLTDEQRIDRAASIEQTARRMCLTSRDATDGDKARWYALSVYARRILRIYGKQNRGWVGLWLKPGLARRRT